VRADSINADWGIKVADRDATKEERRTNLSYRKRKMVIKHDEEMARNKMKVDVLLWEKTEWEFKERGYSIIQNGNENGDEVLREYEERNEGGRAEVKARHEEMSKKGKKREKNTRKVPSNEVRQK
jgi:hypothetical protein